MIIDRVATAEKAFPTDLEGIRVQLLIVVSITLRVTSGGDSPM